MCTDKAQISEQCLLEGIEGDLESFNNAKSRLKDSETGDVVHMANDILIESEEWGMCGQWSTSIVRSKVMVCRETNCMVEESLSKKRGWTKRSRESKLRRVRNECWVPMLRPQFSIPLKFSPCYWGSHKRHNVVEPLSREGNGMRIRGCKCCWPAGRCCFHSCNSWWCSLFT